MKEVYELMKKTLSRFLCALLVVAMVCAMAPAALAAAGDTYALAPIAIKSGAATSISTVSGSNTTTLTTSVTKTSSGNTQSTVENPTITWTPSNDNVTLTGNSTECTVTGNKVGSSTITASYTADGQAVTQTYTITVNSAVTGISLSPLTLALTPPTTTGTIIATLTGGALGDTVTAKSSDETVATVTVGTVAASNGTATATISVTAKKAGTANITASCNGQSTTSACVVTVSATGHDVSFANKTRNVLVGNKVTQSATATSGDTVAYKSSDTTVATVNTTTGEVTGVKAGTATITATTSNNGVELASATYIVIVYDKYYLSLSTYPTSTSINVGSTTAIYATITENVINSSTNAVS
jgi:uncharacterized protein YjdB